MCGEKSFRICIRISDFISPPRVRGKEVCPAEVCPAEDITPACAGKRVQFVDRAAHLRDHPRVCGEKSTPQASFIFAEGSPPRVRGKEYRPVYSRMTFGITPACAGKSSLCSRYLIMSDNHPRVCGEKFPTELIFSIDKGSPPRVRGKANAFATDSWEVRITPACAGKSQPVQVRRAGDGITPARAGKSLTLSSSVVSSKDHPRACGEKTLVAVIPTMGAGSPPRVRGKGPTRFRTRRNNGITPARAGKRWFSACRGRMYWDHPRACGEKRKREFVL